jgi:ligand-binding SRPBCC domain-containing protein
MMSQPYLLERSQRIERPLPEVFDFFANAANLEALTPPFLRFRIITALPIEMRAGTRIEYRLSLWGVPLRWRTLISCFEPNRRFIDEQESGPYAHWHHVHEFEPEGQATRMRDRVSYRLPLGLLGKLAHALWVKRQLDVIFEYRSTAIARLLEEAAA